MPFLNSTSIVLTSDVLSRTAKAELFLSGLGFVKRALFVKQNGYMISMLTMWFMAF